MPGATEGEFDARLYDQVCFACGARNEHGLHLHFSRDGALEGGGAVILVGALSFVPALALGPIAEALQPPAAGGGPR